MRLRQQLILVSAVGAFIFAFELINIFSARALLEYGIVPRSLSSLPHIFTSVFLHASFGHFLSNILTLCAFSFLLLQYGKKRYFTVTIVLIVCTGLLVWLFARTGVHLGASGLVYGYFSYLVLAGFLGRSFRLFGLSLLVAFFYGSMVFGILPQQGFVSWESHLFGFIVGLALAYVFRDKSHLRTRFL